MDRRKRPLKKVALDSDEEDVPSPSSQKRSRKDGVENSSQSQRRLDPMDVDDNAVPSTQAARRALGEVTAEVREHLIGNVVRLFLFNEARHALTKRADIVANAIGGEYKDKNLSKAVIDEAKMRLLHVFGFEVVELQGKQRGSYVLRSKFLPENLSNDFLEEMTKTLSERERSERGLLIIVLSLILINNYSITQDALFRYVQQLGFGEPNQSTWWVNAIAKTFPAQNYVVKKKETAGEQTRILYLFGERALIEIGKKRILFHVAKMLGEDVDAVKLKEIEDELNGVPPESDDEGVEPAASQATHARKRATDDDAADEERTAKKAKK